MFTKYIDKLKIQIIKYNITYFGIFNKVESVPQKDVIDNKLYFGIFSESLKISCNNVDITCGITGI